MVMEEDYKKKIFTKMVFLNFLDIYIYLLF